MANPFVALQRFSQDEQGRTLILVDYSNYNGIIPVTDDKFVNSSGNEDTVAITDFISRVWITEDILGNLIEYVFPYDIPQLNACAIPMDADKYLKVTMIIKTAVNTYQSTAIVGVHRKAEYKLYVLANQEKCCAPKFSQKKIDAKNFIDSAKFKLDHYDELGYQTDITAANKLLDSIL